VRGIVEVERKVADFGDEAVELGIGGVDASKFDDAGAHVCGEFVSERAARDTDDGELLRQKIALPEMKERRQELAFGEVAGGAKNNQDPWVGNPLSAFGELREILGAHCHLHSGHGRKTSGVGRQSLALSH